MTQFDLFKKITLWRIFSWFHQIRLFQFQIFFAVIWIKRGCKWHRIVHYFLLRVACLEITLWDCSSTFAIDRETETCRSEIDVSDSSAPHFRNNFVEYWKVRWFMTWTQAYLISWAVIPFVHQYNKLCHQSPTCYKRNICS